MLEWSERSKYNSFNSVKGLAYYEKYKKIISWLNKKTDILPPPIECNLDPIAECNLKCYFCITQRYLKNNRNEIGNMRKLPVDYVLRLIKFLGYWGVKGLCLSGGGEPSIHEGVPKFISEAKFMGMDVAFITNVTNISNELADSLMLCRWIALSIDSLNKEMYKSIKGVDKFDAVINNVKKLVSLRSRSNSKVDLCFKLLVLPENYKFIWEICKLAKNLEVQDFHVRPVDFERKDIKNAQKLIFDMNIIKEEFLKCHDEETRDFHVYTIAHKFDEYFHVKHDFEKCLATPLVIPILSNGNAYLCVDRKVESRFELGSCYPDPENILSWWGSDDHRNLIKSVNINQCSRCTWSQYNQQIEEVVMNDRMCLSFP